MKKIFLLFFIFLFIASCTENDYKQKESKLKEKELELKEKELALREKEFSQKDSIVQKSLKQTMPDDTFSKDKSLSNLVINPQNIGGDLGQVTFSQKGKVIFYFNNRLQEGKIIINRIEYILTKLSEDSNNGSYLLSGENVEIAALNCKYHPNDVGSDCAYGHFLNVKISLNGITTSLKNVELQDCTVWD
jgi:hypothetical protein